MSRRILLAWSGGKDSAYALGRLKRCPAFEVAGLLTTLRADGRVAMHELPQSLVSAQAKAIGLPLWECVTGETPYEEAMRAIFGKARAQGIESVAYGDLFLEDIRAFRLRLHEGTGVTAFFPLFGEDTAVLPSRILQEGYRAVVTAVDRSRLSPELCGRGYDAEFLAALPDGIDPCGERGEFHTFVYDAPYFSAPVPYALGGFRDLHFEDPKHPFHARVCDLVPNPS